MVTAVIVAGGSGLRMKASIRKQYLPISRRPILARTIALFSDHPEIERIILVIPQDDELYVRDEILSHISLDKPLETVRGGKERQDSVFNGLTAIPESNGWVVIHDGVRPFVKPELITRCIRKAQETGACILGVPASDTLKSVTDAGEIAGTLSRHNVWQAQTPQVFELGAIREAHEKAKRENIRGTDDASLVERLGKVVAIVRGSRENIKITSPEDLALAEGILLKNEQKRETADAS